MKNEIPENPYSRERENMAFSILNSLFCGEYHFVSDPNSAIEMAFKITDEFLKQAGRK